MDYYEGKVLLKWLALPALFVFGYVGYIVFKHVYVGIASSVNISSWDSIGQLAVPLVPIAFFLACVFGAYMRLANAGKKRPEKVWRERLSGYPVRKRPPEDSDYE